MELVPYQGKGNMHTDSEPETLDIDLTLLESIDSRRQISAMDAFSRLRQAQQKATPSGTPLVETTFDIALPESLMLGGWVESLLQDNQPFPEPSTETIPTAGPEQLQYPETDTQVETQATESVCVLGLVSPDALRVPATIFSGEASEENDHVEWPEATEEDSTEFEKIELWYKGIEAPSLEDEVRFERAKQQEARRGERVSNRLAIEAQCPSDHEPEDAAAEELQCRIHTQQTGLQIKKQRRKNRISAEEQRHSMQLGLDSLSGPKTADRKRYRKRKADQMDDGTDIKDSEDVPFDFDAFFCSDVVAEGHENVTLPVCPGFTSNNKRKALTQLVASIPSADQEEAKSDKRKILEATRKFTTPAKCDGQNGWRIKGMATSLLNYQLLGAGFMRDREKSTEPPQGGLLCDIMGYGKTIQALANIVDGSCVDQTDPIRTTLIVVPSHLVATWMDQISKHCNKIGDTLIYDARHKFQTLNVIQDMQKFNVIITTYDMVRRSYPLSKIKRNGSNNHEIGDSWEEFYLKTVGPLHKIKFLRIILDEGHLIRNRFSTTSIAVRALTGKYKWILSGTPAINGVNDLYAQFNFLGHECAKDYNYFLKHYRHTQDGEARLRNVCRTLIYRRTHASRLFKRPLINLPDISRTVVTIDFCDVERRIYCQIRNDCISSMNEFCNRAKARYLQSNCFLAMILKLRMISNHLLTNQNVIKDLLMSDIFAQELYKLGTESKDPEHPSAQITRCLMGLKKGNFFPAPRQEHEELGKLCKELSGDREELVNEFREFMNELHEEQEWLERAERVTCPCCGMPPIEPIVTDCMHLYCEECFLTLENDDPTEDRERKCMASTCGQIIQKAAFVGSFESMVQEPSRPATQIDMSLENAKKARWMASKAESGKPKPKNKSSNSRTNSTRDESFDKDQESDWISACGGQMPSAKLEKIRELIQNWIEENPDVKVVVFTLFLDFIRIATMMCQQQGWQCYPFTGKMPIPDRDQSIQEFRENPQARVLVASLKAGGIGLDMSMANKCILVDLWWNEAIQEQAFCRLYRIGQQRDVEIVKLLVRDTMDDYILKLQLEKTDEIDGTIGEQQLGKRDTIVRLLRMFADVKVLATGGITVNLDGKGKQAKRTK